MTSEDGRLGPRHNHHRDRLAAGDQIPQQDRELVLLLAVTGRGRVVAIGFG
jgi:hypothetical protein